MSGVRWSAEGFYRYDALLKHWSLSPWFLANGLLLEQRMNNNFASISPISNRCRISFASVSWDGQIKTDMLNQFWSVPQNWQHSFFNHAWICGSSSSQISGLIGVWITHLPDLLNTVHALSSPPSDASVTIIQYCKKCPVYQSYWTLVRHHQGHAKWWNTDYTLNNIYDCTFW